MYFPLKHNLSQEDVLRASKEQKMKDVIYDLASEAHKQLDIVSVVSRGLEYGFDFSHS